MLIQVHLLLENQLHKFRANHVAIFEMLWLCIYYNPRYIDSISMLVVINVIQVLYFN